MHFVERESNNVHFQLEEDSELACSFDKEDSFVI
jgi:hypothetical protein